MTIFAIVVVQTNQKELIMPLTLSRKEQESIVVFTSSDEQIEITITKIDNNQVRLSFAGPDTIDIWRSELLQIQGDED